MSDRLRIAFEKQGRSCARLGSPFMGRLMPLLGARLAAGAGGDGAVAARCRDWPGELGPAGHSVPLRLAGALHGLVLDGSDPELRAVYPPRAGDDAALGVAIDAALHRHGDRILDWLDRAPQTNEVRRAAAILAGIRWAETRTGPLPLRLSELGASAGLNLLLDRFAIRLGGAWHDTPDSAVRLAPDWTGPLPVAPTAPVPLDVRDRAGVDLAPLDPCDPADALRLLAYLWPDQPERLERTRAAIALARDAARDAACPPVAAGDAAPWLAARLARTWPGLHVVYSTVAAQYFPDATREAVAASLDAAGARATAAAPLLHLAMEADADPRGAGLAATLWTGGPPLRRALARVCFHGAWIDWLDRPFGPRDFPLDEG